MVHSTCPHCGNAILAPVSLASQANACQGCVSPLPAPLLAHQPLVMLQLAVYDGPIWVAAEPPPISPPLGLWALRWSLLTFAIFSGIAGLFALVVVLASLADRRLDSAVIMVIPLLYLLMAVLLLVSFRAAARQKPSWKAWVIILVALALLGLALTCVSTWVLHAHVGIDVHPAWMLGACGLSGAILGAGVAWAWGHSGTDADGSRSATVAVLSVMISVLVTVLPIVAALGAGLGEASMQMAESSRCQQSLQNLHEAIETYAAGHDGLLPSRLIEAENYSKVRGDFLTCRGESYGCILESPRLPVARNRQLLARINAPLVWDALPHGKRKFYNVLLMDGSIRQMNAGELRQRIDEAIRLLGAPIRSESSSARKALQQVPSEHRQHYA